MSDRDLRIKLIFEALDGVTKPLANIGAGGEKARAALAATKAEMKALNAAQKDLSKFTDLSASYAKTAADLAAAEKATKALREELALIEKPTKNLQSAFDKAERAEAKLRGEHERQGQTLTELSRKMEATGVDLSDLTGHEERLKLRAYETNRALTEQTKKLDALKAASNRAQSFKEAGGNMMGMGGTAIGAGVAMGAPVMMAYDNAKTFEASVADIKKVLDFTPAGLRLINQDLLDMSTRVPLAKEGLAQIAAAAGRAGVAQEAIRRGDYEAARQELMAFTEEAAKMGVAFDITAEDAGATMAKWKTAFNLPQEQITVLGDQINALTNRYGGNAAAVTDMVTRIGALGEVAGVAPNLLAAMAQTMNSVGVESEIGATGIKNMMLALTKGEAATKSQAAAFAKLGLDASKVSKAMQADSSGTIIDVLARLQGLSKDAQAGVLTELFGSESVAAIAPMLTQLDQLKNNITLIGDQSQYAGSMNAEFLARIATTEGITGLAGNALAALNTELGTGLLPTVNAIAPEITKLANGFRKWSAEHPALSGALMTFVAIASGLIIALGAIGVAAGAATFAFGALGITTWAALWPILAIIAAVALIGAGIYLLVTHFDTVKRVGLDTWNTIMEWGGKAVDFLTYAFMNFTPVGLFIQAFTAVWDYFKNLDLGKIGGDIVLGIVNGILFGIPGLIGAFIKMAAAGIDAFKDKLGIKSPSRVMMGMGGFINEGLADGLAASQSGPIGRMKRIADAIAGQVDTGAKTFGGAGGGFSPPAFAGAAGGGRPAPIQIGTLTIPVQAATGQSTEDLVQQIWDMFQAKMEELQARARSAFKDDED